MMQDSRILDAEIINDNVRSSAFAKLMRNVYLWMTFALVATGLTALYVSNDIALVQKIASNSIAFWGLLIAELAIVVILSSAINRISFPVAGLMFAAYSVLNGVTFSFIFLAYTMSSIATTFFITAGTFGAMTLVGMFTKKDLSGMGRILIMGLIGIIIATIVNIFVGSSMLDWAITYIGVLIFVGLTAYDTQKIRVLMLTHGTDVNDGTMKLALLGALTLYLDFINLFLYLLRIFGRRN